MERYKYEQDAYNQGYQCIAGCDEAGRGPLAGPLVVAAVIFKKGYYNELINDSKKITSKKRTELFDLILKEAKDYTIVIKTVAEVDEENVYQASRLGMIEAVNQLKFKVDCVLTDAMPLKNTMHCVPIIKGDQKSISIAASSILAKVTRDKIMEEYDEVYPEYGFKKHKGYPTKLHKEALNKYGVTAIHRKSFKPIKEILNKQLELKI
jgi:Ribonuclease HII